MARTPAKTKKSPARPPSAKRSAPTKTSSTPAAAATNTAGATLDELTRRVEGLNLQSLTFHNQYAFPCLVKTLPYTGRERKVVLDFHIVSLSDQHFVVDLVDSKIVTLAVILPKVFLDANRLKLEYHLQGDRDALITSHNEVLEDIENHYGKGLLKVSHPPQMVALPFQCEADFEHEIIWNIGDEPLYQYLLSIGANQPHQMCPVLRVTLRGIEKLHHNNTWRPGRVVGSGVPGGGVPLAPAPAPAAPAPAAPAPAPAPAAPTAPAPAPTAPVPAPAPGGGVPAAPAPAPGGGVNIHAANVQEAQRRQAELRSAQRNAAEAAAARAAGAR